MDKSIQFDLSPEVLMVLQAVQRRIEAAERRHLDYLKAQGIIPETAEALNG